MKRTSYRNAYYILLLILTGVSCQGWATTHAPRVSYDGTFTVDFKLRTLDGELEWGIGSDTLYALLGSNASQHRGARQRVNLSDGTYVRQTYLNLPNGNYRFWGHYCRPTCNHHERPGPSATVTVVRQPPTPGVIELPSGCFMNHRIHWPYDKRANRFEVQQRNIHPDGSDTGWVPLTNTVEQGAHSAPAQGTGSGQGRQYRVRARFFWDSHIGQPSGWRYSAVCPGNRAPSVAITAPQALSHSIPGQPITITIDASDPDGSIDRVEVYANGTLIPSGILRTAPYSLVWSPEQLGDFTLTAKAFDNVDTSSTSAGRKVVITDKPVAKVVSPPPNSRIGVGKTITIEATATDNDGIGAVIFYVNGVNLGFDAYTPFTWQWTVPSFGQHIITAVAADREGSLSESAPVVVVTGIDPNPPAHAPTGFRIDGSTHNTTGVYTLSWDDVLLANQYAIWRCAKATCQPHDWIPRSPSENRFLSEAGLASGTYQYLVAACNENGCSGSGDALVVTVALPAPQRPGPTRLKTSNVCSEGVTTGTSTGSFEICWEASQGTVTHYEVDEKIGLGHWQYLQSVFEGTSLDIEGKTTRSYQYRVKACNSIDQQCSESGGRLTVFVIDTPILFAAIVACDDECIQISGLGIDASSRVEVRAIGGTDTLSVHSDVFLPQREGAPPTALQVPVNDAVRTALNTTGVALTVINPGNDNRSQIYAFGGNAKVLLPPNRASVLASAPRLSNNAVVYTAIGDAVYAFSSSGEPLPGWPVTVAGPVTQTPALSVEQDVVYAATVDGQLHAVYAADSPYSGQTKWQLMVSPQQALSAPEVDEQGIITVHSEDQKTYRIDSSGVLYPTLGD